MQIQAAGRFRVSVLGSQHEQLCRDFARDPAARFTTGSWVFDEHGMPILSDALSWFDADISTVSPAGDHLVVVARVSDFGVGDGAAGLPLLYLKGSYGSFAVPRLEFDLTEFGSQLRMADHLRAVISELAETSQVDCLLTTVVRDSVVVLASAQPQAPSGAPEQSMVGASFPFAAPMAPVFAAWSSPERASVWVENSRHLLGSVDRPFLTDLLGQVRTLGYSVSVGEAMATHFDSVISHPNTNRSHLASLWTQITRDYRELHRTVDWAAHASSVQVPVFGQDGTTQLELVVSGFTPDRFDDVIERSLSASAALTQRLDGATSAGLASRGTS
jgi:hypothetical protein